MEDFWCCFVESVTWPVRHSQVGQPRRHREGEKAEVQEKEERKQLKGSNTKEEQGRTALTDCSFWLSGCARRVYRICSVAWSAIYFLISKFPQFRGLF